MEIPEKNLDATNAKNISSKQLTSVQHKTFGILPPFLYHAYNHVLLIGIHEQYCIGYSDTSCLLNCEYLNPDRNRHSRLFPLVTRITMPLCGYPSPYECCSTNMHFLCTFKKIIIPSSWLNNHDKGEHAGTDSMQFH